jgi:hypothetical protein
LKSLNKIRSRLFTAPRRIAHQGIREGIHHAHGFAFLLSEVPLRRHLPLTDCCDFMLDAGSGAGTVGVEGILGGIARGVEDG